MEMELELVRNARIVAETILWVCAAIISVGGAVAIINKLLNPHRSLKGRVERHDELLDKDKKRFDQMEKNIADDQMTTRMMCRAVIALLEHAITGNSVDKLKEAKAALQQHLIDN